MKLSLKRGTTSKRIRIAVENTTSTTGAGLVGLVYNSAGLVWHYIREDQNTPTSVPLVTATLGTWTSGGFKEVDSSAMPGVYEIGIPNAALQSGAAVHMWLGGAANMAPVLVEIELTGPDNQDAATGGLSLLAGITSLANWLRALARKSTPDATALSEIGGTYDATTDALEALRDRGDSAWGASGVGAEVWTNPERTLTNLSAQIAASVSGSTLTVRRGDSYSGSLTGLGSLAGRTKLWVTVKQRPASDSDADAVIGLVEGTGLTRLNGAAATAAQGSVTVTDESTGALTIALAAAATAALTPAYGYTYDVQILTASGVRTVAQGTLHVEADVTRAVS